MSQEVSEGVGCRGTNKTGQSGRLNPEVNSVQDRQGSGVPGRIGDVRPGTRVCVSDCFCWSESIPDLWEKTGTSKLII